MGLAIVHDLGWRGRASRGANACSGRIMQACIPVLGAGLAGGLIWAGASDLAAASALVKRFGSIHAFFGAALLSGLLFAGLSLFSSLAAGVLAVAEAAPRLAFGGALLGALPFAQVSDTPAGRDEKRDRPTISVTRWQAAP